MVLLAGAVLSGCAGKDSKRAEDGKTGGSEASGKMGRYMEQEVKLPELDIWSAPIGMVEDQEGAIHYFVQTAREQSQTIVDISCYDLKEDNTWEKKEKPWLSALVQELKKGGSYISSILQGQDGSYYALLESSNPDETSLYCSADEIAVKKMDIAYFHEKVKMEEKEYSRMILSIGVLENGNLVVDDLLEKQGMVLLSGKNGKKLAVIPTWKDDGAAGRLFQVSGNHVVCANPDGTGIQIYNTETEEISEFKEFDFGKSQAGLFVSKEGTIYMGNGDGIHRIEKNGTLWETVVDGGLNSMGMPSNYFSQLMVRTGKPEEFYAGYLDNTGSVSLMHYVYDESVSAVPEKELTVYSLYENKTVRQSIALFQKQHDDVKVNYIVAMGNEGGTVSDYIRALNTELLAGKGADVLILDGLPVESYVEKGVLEDMSGFLKEMLASGELHPGIMSDYEKDGKVYGVPLRFEVPYIIGEKEAVEHGSDIWSMADYLEQNKNKQYLKTNSSLARILFILNFESFLDEKGVLKKEEFLKYLEQSKKIIDNNGKATEEEVNIGSYGINNESLTNSLTKGFDLFDIVEKKAQVALGQMGSLFDYYIPYAAEKEYGYTHKVIDNRYIPNGLAALNHAGSQMDLGIEFIKLMLSEEVQRIDLGDGFPILSPTLENMLIKENSSLTERYVSISSSESDVVLNGTFPPLEARKALLDELKRVDRPTVFNQTLEDMVMSELSKYYKGESTAQQTAEAVASKVNMYLAE